MKKLSILFFWVILNLILTLTGITSAQTKHFHSCWEGQQPFSPMNIFIIEAKYNSQDLTTNDEIGIFDGTLCVGAGLVTVPISLSSILEIVASKDDGISGLGFKEGNKILFKIWDESAKKEFSLDSNEVKFHDLQTGNPIKPVPFAGLGTAVVSLKGAPKFKLNYFTKKLPGNVTLPKIDGKTDEFFWNLVKEDTLLFGGVPGTWGSKWTNWTNNFVTWKAVWSIVSNKLYVAITMKDNIRSVFDNNNPTGLFFEPWNDDCLELFTDGNHDGGLYEGSYAKAQQWLITGENKIVLDDYPGPTQLTLYQGPDLITAVSWGSSGDWICEAEFNIYNTFPTVRKTLTVGDTIGWNIWYDDSDNKTLKNNRYIRDYQLGWQYTGPADTNADYFGNMILAPDLSYILVNSPNGGEYWRVDSLHSITWSSHNLTGNVKIEISIDAGETWSMVVPSTANTGNYSWKPTITFKSKNCLIKITSLTNSNIFDQSDSTFIISDKNKVNMWIDTNLFAPKGSTTTIPIHVSDLTGLSVWSADLTISYDPKVIQINATDISGTILAAVGWSPPTLKTTTGQIVLAMAGSAPLSGSGILIKLVGNVSGNLGESTILHFDNARLNEGDPFVLTNDGLFKVTTAFNIKGQLGYYNNFAITIKDATVKLSGAAIKSSASDVNGNYEFLHLATGDYTVKPEKSNDNRGAITPFDASLILRYTVGSITLTPYQKIAGDVSGNGEVTSYDASFILRYSVGAITTFPVGADWTFVPPDFPINDTNWLTSPRSRSYSPLQTDQLNQNFMSILYGDVSGNWTATQGTGSSITVDLDIGDSEPTSDGNWSVPLEIQFFDVAYSGGFKILFNETQLKFEAASLLNLAANVIYETAISEGGVNLVFASALSLNNQQLQIKLLFKGLTSITPTPADIKIANLFIDDNPAIISAVKKDQESEIPTSWDLSQNHPNPFNAETIISYQVPRFSHVKIEVFNLVGQRLQTLVNDVKNPGAYQTHWDGKDDQGKMVSSGIYIYRMGAGNFVAIRKMALVQ